MGRAADQIADAVRRAILQMLGAAFAVVALGFLTVAGWIAVAEAYDQLVAALAVAAAYLLVAFILFLLARRRTAASDMEDEAYEASRPPAPPLLDAFMMGLRTGQRLRRR